MKKYDEKLKEIIIQRYTKGESISNIYAETNIPRSTIYGWLKKAKETTPTVKKEMTRREFRNLQNKTERQNKIIEILQRVNCRVDSPLREKLYALEALYPEYPVHVLCDALQVPRGTFYNHIRRNKKDDVWYKKRRVQLSEKIRQIYDDSRQIFGAKKIRAILKEEGYHVSVSIVQELMQEMGISSIRQTAKKDYDKEQKKLKNMVNQNFNVNKPNAVWVGDFTHFRVRDQVYYICVVLDLYARRIIAHKVSTHASTQLIKSTFAMAYRTRNPGPDLIFHSDQGTQYTSYTFRTYLKSLGVSQSFSRAHVPYDNSVVESFFANMKKEELYRTKFRSEKEFRKVVDEYIQFYNEKRPHASLMYQRPCQKEAEWEKKHSSDTRVPDDDL